MRSGLILGGGLVVASVAAAANGDQERRAGDVRQRVLVAPPGLVARHGRHHRQYAGSGQGAPVLVKRDVLGDPEVRPLEHYLLGGRDLRRAIIRGLSPDPDARQRSMDALLAQLEASSRSSRRWLAVAGAAALGAAVAIGTRSSSVEEPPLCTGASAAWAKVWSPQRLDALVRTSNEEQDEFGGLARLVEEELTRANGQGH